MKAVVLEKYRAPLREVSRPLPEPGPRQVLVDVVAAGVNHADERMRTGEFSALFRPTLPAVAGIELSGTVRAVGSAVTEVRVGDAVFACTGEAVMGAFAEVAVVDVDAVAPVPTSTSPVEAAALPVVALTAWQGLVGIGRLTAGQRVLIHGGAGGVGSVAIQLATHLGASVVTTVSARDADAVRALGADEVIDYRTQDVVEVLRDRPVDLVLDTRGGAVTTASLQVTRRGGTVIGIAGTPEPSLADQVGAGRLVKAVLAVMSLPLRRRARARGVTYRFLFIHLDGAALRTIAGLVDDGVLRPSVGRVLPLARAGEALAQVSGGGVRGKVLVTTDARAVTPED